LEQWTAYKPGGGEDEEKLDFLELLGLGEDDCGTPPLFVPVLMASLLG
jgi:hypothetical protein